MLRDLECVRRIQIVRHLEKVSTFESHVAKIVLDIDHVSADVHRREPIRSCVGSVSAYCTVLRMSKFGPPTAERIGAQELGVGTRRSAIVAIARLRVASTPGEDKVGVVAIKVAHAVIMPIQNRAMVLSNDLDERLQVGDVLRGGVVRVMNLQELPFSFGLAEGLREEVYLLLSRFVTAFGVGVEVHRGILWSK